MSQLKRFAPWFIVGAAVVYVIGTMVPAAISTEKMNVEGFGDLIVLDKGRYKPLDTYARTALKSIANREDVSVDRETFTNKPEDAGVDRETLPATRWLLDLLATGLAGHYQTVVILDPELVKELNL